MIAPGIMSPAESIAASLCWLARMRPGRTLGPESADQVTGYWHRSSCRFCKTKPEDLMAQITTSQADPRYDEAVVAFERLPRAARAARVREAMTEAWYDAVTR